MWGRVVNDGKSALLRVAGRIEPFRTRIEPDNRKWHGADVAPTQKKVQQSGATPGATLEPVIVASGVATRAGSTDRIRLTSLGKPRCHCSRSYWGIGEGNGRMVDGVGSPGRRIARCGTVRPHQVLLGHLEGNQKEGRKSTFHERDCTVKYGEVAVVPDGGMSGEAG